MENRKLVISDDVTAALRDVGVQKGQAFEQTGQVCRVPLGNGILTMMRQRALVDFAVKWIGENRK